MAGSVPAGDQGVAAPGALVAHDDSEAHDGQGTAAPVVTILMPAKDPHPEYFAEALASVREQTSPRWRLLVIVEPEDLDSFSNQVATALPDPRVRVVANEGRKLAGAVNTGMRRADTDFVALLLADDLWYPNAVAVLDDTIRRHPDVDFLHSGRRIIHPRGISAVYPAPDVVTIDDFRTGAPVKHLLCWRRATGLAAGGLDERSRSVGPDDFDFPWTMADFGARFRGVPECLYAYRDHDDGPRLTTDIPRSVHVRELRRIFRKHGLSREETRARIAHARSTYLRQCRYRNVLDARLRRWLRRPPARWYDQYR